MVVGVGSEISILPAQNATRFSDFLDWHLRKTLGVEWGQAQLAYPLAERHQILQLYDARCRRERQLSLATDGLYVGPLVDAIFAWFSLAYDVYLIRHNSKLQELLVKRLKHKSTFQGARHELAVAANMIVAGFEIAFEDDGDIGSKHVEFVATDKYGVRVAVEAKSRHRPGVLGYQSTDWRKPNYSRFGVESLLRSATEKRTDLPTIVFIDLNVPTKFELELSLWMTALETEVRKVYGGFEVGTFPINAICFSNDDTLQALDGRTNFFEPWFKALEVSDPMVVWSRQASALAGIDLAFRQRRNIPLAFPA